MDNTLPVNQSGANDPINTSLAPLPAVTQNHSVSSKPEPPPSQSATVVPTGAVTGKEKEPVVGTATVSVEAVPSAETVVSKEVKETGVEVPPESVEIPPDLQKLGVQPAGTAIPVTSTIPQPQAVTVALPIADDQVMAGLHANIKLSLRWFAVWCLRKLKKAHLMVKKVHGKVFRVKYQ